MKVTLELEKNSCLVEREPTDKPLTRSGYYGTDPDSIFYYRVKKELLKQGYDVITKRMWQDGHMYGNESTIYIRTRNKEKGFEIYDGDYALRLAFDDFNKKGIVHLLAAIF